MLQFSASQSVNMAVPTKSVPIRHYLQKPRRLVQALMNPEQVETLGFDRFRFSLQPFKFIVLKIQPVVDLEVKVSEAGNVKLRSTDCEIRGNQIKTLINVLV
ncbi:MAG: DUF1997 domain-containing protein, partial [Leptolyngbya sp. SIO4C5]|nr:DUF1997 domain-containing protein [Leptolyngbya sp. SIO4C5]